MMEDETMMLSEFIERTGFEPMADEYAEIEEAYHTDTKKAAMVLLKSTPKKPLSFEKYLNESQMGKSRRPLPMT